MSDNTTAPEPLLPEYEAEIRARVEAATPGPWQEHPAYGEHFYAYLGGSYLRGVGTLNFGDGEDAEADRAFTLHAREDITALLAELDRVRTERDQYAAELDGLRLAKWEDEQQQGPGSKATPTGDPSP